MRCQHFSFVNQFRSNSSRKHSTPQISSALFVLAMSSLTWNFCSPGDNWKQRVDWFPKWWLSYFDQQKECNLFSTVYVGWLAVSMILLTEHSLNGSARGNLCEYYKLMHSPLIGLVCGYINLLTTWKRKEHPLVVRSYPKFQLLAKLPYLHWY